MCFCPTTERDLADGIGPARALVDAGARCAWARDSHAVIDLFEEARAVELDERLRDEQRGHFSADELLHRGHPAGHAALGWPDAGTIAARRPGRPGHGARWTPYGRPAFDDPAAGGACSPPPPADVTDVVVDGRPIVHDGRHLLVGDVAERLADAIAAVWA